MAFFLHFRENGICLVVEMNAGRLNPPNTVFELNDAINLSNLASGVTATKSTGTDDIGPMLPTMEKPKLTLHLTESGFISDIEI
jgi:hypothetical protein